MRSCQSSPAGFHSKHLQVFHVGSGEPNSSIPSVACRMASCFCTSITYIRKCSLVCNAGYSFMQFDPGWFAWWARMVAALIWLRDSVIAWLTPNTVSLEGFFTMNSYVLFDFLVDINEFYCFSTLYIHTYVSFVFSVFWGGVAAWSPLLMVSRKTT